MAIFEESGVAFNTHLICTVGPVKGPPTGNSEYTIVSSGAQPVIVRFNSKGEAAASRKKLLDIIDAGDAHPR